MGKFSYFFLLIMLDTLNTQVHEATHHTPYEMVFGQPPRSLLLPDPSCKQMINEEDLLEPDDSSSMDDEVEFDDTAKIQLKKSQSNVSEDDNQSMDNQDSNEDLSDGKSQQPKVEQQKILFKKLNNQIEHQIMPPGKHITQTQWQINQHNSQPEQQIDQPEHHINQPEHQPEHQMDQREQQSHQPESDQETNQPEQHGIQSEQQSEQDSIYLKQEISQPDQQSGQCNQQGFGEPNSNEQMHPEAHELKKKPLATFKKHKNVREKADYFYRRNAERMKKRYSMHHKIKELAVGQSVSLRIPRIDRTCTDVQRLPCIVIQVVGRSRDMYRLRCKSGVLDRCYRTDNLEPFDGDYQIPLIGWETEKKITLREAARQHAPWNAFIERCNCHSRKCDTRRCSCKKAGLTCRTYCHKGLTCKNKECTKGKYLTCI